MLLNRLVQGQLDLFWVAVQTSIPFLVAGIALGALARDKPPQPPGLDQRVPAKRRCRDGQGMKIVQIAPDIGPGSGVAGVAYALEQEWLADGLEVSRFTMSDAHGDWIPTGVGGLRGRLAHVLRVVWFSSVGTVAARRHLARQPDAVSVCHNDALAGDVYVNHGILEEAMRARGHYVLRMVRNPLHVVTWVRDRWRYGAHGPHRLVVNLSSQDDTALHRSAPAPELRRRPSSATASTSTASPPLRPTSAAAHAAELGLTDDDVVLAFVGHEFDRKGLRHLVAALTGLPDVVRVVVVGGDADMVRAAEEHAAGVGVSGRVHFVGRVPDPRPALAAADLFALPSAYEAYPLVVLEALACGLPVIVTPTGGTTDVVVNGTNGWVVEATDVAITAAVRAYLEADRSAMRAQARETAERLTWDAVAERYLGELSRLRSLVPARG